MIVGVPFGHILGPLVVWLLKRDDSPAVDAHGKEALNFQISLTLYFMALVAVTAVLCLIVIGVLLIPLLIAAAVVGPVIDIIFVVLASLKAGNGEFYRYPFTIRFLA